MKIIGVFRCRFYRFNLSFCPTSRMPNSIKTFRINRLKRIRVWERSNLPTYGTDAGYALLLELASLEDGSDITLKGLYLSIPYAESTIRLLFRNLEEDGWIELPKDHIDRRFKSFVATEKFHRKVDEWLDQVADYSSEV